MQPVIVLFVDERREMLELRKATLESLGYSVETASDGVSAINKLREVPVHVVLLEYKTEGMDAEAVALHLKQRFPKVPIVLLSAFAEMPERILWLVDEYVLKSDPPETWRRVIERVVCRPSTSQAHMPPAGMDMLRQDATAA